VQILDAVAYMHRCRTAHRDLKPLNIVLQTRQGADTRLKLCDFGTSRVVRVTPIPKDRSVHEDEKFEYTTGCTTLWYRPPEQMLPEVDRYDPFSLDLWSVGCVIAEMVRLRPLVVVRSEAEALGVIFWLLGTPTEATWPGVSSLPFAPSPRAWPQRVASTAFAQLRPLVPPGVMSVLDGMLQACPHSRMSAASALACMEVPGAVEQEEPVRKRRREKTGIAARTGRRSSRKHH